MLTRKRMLLIVIVTSGACRAAVGSHGIDLDTRRAELRAAHSALERDSRSRGLTEAFAAVFAPSGYHLSPGPLTPGPAGARAIIARDTLNATSSVVWTVVRHDVSHDGRDGYSFGYFDVVRANGDTQPGRFHAYWRRSPSGNWQLLAIQRGRRAAGSPTSAVPSEILARASIFSGIAERDTTRSIETLRDVERAFYDSTATNLAAAFANYAAPDGAKFPGPNATSYVFGRAAIADLFAGAPRGSGPAWRPEVISAASSGDLGFTFGPAWPRQQGANPPSPVAGRYFSIWRKQSDGSWKYVID
jgi:ketosteroid isomerase-like protein